MMGFYTLMMHYVYMTRLGTSQFYSRSSLATLRWRVLLSATIHAHVAA